MKRASGSNRGTYNKLTKNKTSTEKLPKTGLPEIVITSKSVVVGISVDGSQVMSIVRKVSISPNGQ